MPKPLFKDEWYLHYSFVYMRSLSAAVVVVVLLLLPLFILTIIVAVGVIVLKRNLQEKGYNNL